MTQIEKIVRAADRLERAIATLKQVRRDVEPTLPVEAAEKLLDGLDDHFSAALQQLEAGLAFLSCDDCGGPAARWAYNEADCIGPNRRVCEPCHELACERQAGAL